MEFPPRPCQLKLTDDETRLRKRCQKVGSDLRKATESSWDLQKEVGKRGSKTLVQELFYHGALWCGSRDLCHSLAQCGHLECLQFLLHCGKLDVEGAAEGAAECNQVAVLQFLHEKKQKISTTVLTRAISSQHEDTVRYLLSIGFRPDEYDLTVAQGSVRQILDSYK